MNLCEGRQGWKMANQSTSYFKVIPILSHDLHKKYAISVSVNTLLFFACLVLLKIFSSLYSGNREYITLWTKRVKIHFLSLPVFADLCQWLKPASYFQEG